MYASASSIKGLPIISLQTSEAIAGVTGFIIEAAKFEVLALTCQSGRQSHDYLVMSSDIRQLATDCVIIDHQDELTDPEDLIRLQDVIKAAYSPLDKSVVTENGHRLGIVEDYLINLETYRIQQIIVGQPMWRFWDNQQHAIDRTQIIDVTPKQIVVREALVKVPLMSADTIPGAQP